MSNDVKTNPLLISPSLLSADFARLGEELKAIEDAGADWVHFDVMDNHFVPNLTFGAMVCQALKPHTNLPIDVHLMVDPVDDLALAFAKAGASVISFHPEASRHVHRSLRVIKDVGCLSGLVFNPATPLDWLDHVLDEVDLILLMSVNPGFGGQSFIPSTLPKIRQLKIKLDQYQKESGRRPRIEVDGGVNGKNAAEIVAAGADTLVAGSAVFGQKDYRAAIDALRC